MDGSNSIGMGCMAVFAVSGSIALLAVQAHKRLLSDFMKKIEFELGSKKCHRNKKKVRFAQSASQTSGICEKETCKTNMAKPCLNRGSKGLESPMPLNRLALYRGIIEYRMHFPKKEYGVSGGRTVSHVRYGSHSKEVL